MGLHKIVNGVRIELTPEEEKAKRAKWKEEDRRRAEDVRVNGHKGKRGREYPSIADQLDMLWHGMQRNEIPKVTAFYDTIAKIKKKYPKATA